MAPLKTAAKSIPQKSVAKSAAKKTPVKTVPKATGKKTVSGDLLKKKPKKANKIQPSAIDKFFSGETIVEFVKDKALDFLKAQGMGGLAWLGNELLYEFGVTERPGPSQLDQIQETLVAVQERLDEILAAMGGVMDEMTYNRLLTEKSGPADRIVNRQHALLRLANPSMPEEQRKHETSGFCRDVEDSNVGAEHDLRKLHRVLMLGETGKKDALISSFMQRWFEAVQKKQLEPDFPLATYAEEAKRWMGGILWLQFLALCQYMNAKRFAGVMWGIEEFVKEVAENLEEQQERFESFIPIWVTETARLMDGRSYVLWSGHEEVVLYGNGRETYYRKRLPNNADEEWIFESALENDMLYLRPRSCALHLGLRGDIPEMNYLKNKPQKLRIVMAKDERAAALKAVEKGEAEFRSLLFPTIGVIGRDSKQDRFLKAPELTEKQSASGRLEFPSLAKMNEAMHLRVTDTGYVVDSDAGSAMGKLVAFRNEEGTLYFLQGSQVRQYDLDKKLAGEVMLMAEAFPGMPFATVEAALAVPGKGVYFFNGENCVLWRAGETAVSPQAIVKAFPEIVLRHVDAAVMLGDGKAILIDRDECVKYDLIERKSLDHVRKLSAVMPALPFGFVDSAVIKGKGYAIMRRGEVWLVDETFQSEKRQPLVDVFPNVIFPRFGEDEDMLAKGDEWPLVYADAGAKPYHGGSMGRLPIGKKLDVGLSVENRTQYRFVMKRQHSETGDAVCTPIEPMGVSGIVVHAQQQWTGYAGPEGEAVFVAEGHPDVQFQVHWDANYAKATRDTLSFLDVKGCIVLPAANSLYKITDKLMRATISVA